MTRIFRLTVELLALAGVAVVGLHYADPGYVMPLWVVLAALAAGGAAAVAADWSCRRGFREAVALSVVIALFVVGVASIMSIGAIMLVLAVISGVIVIRRSAPIPLGAWIGAAVVGLALPGLALLAIQDPIVACTDGWNIKGQNLWLNSRGSSDPTPAIQISTRVGIQSSGSYSIGGQRFVFGCTGDELDYFYRVS